MKWRIMNQTRHTILADDVDCCRGFWKRMRGLLGRPKISSREACWLSPCCSVHTFGMTYPIDLYVLDREDRVIAAIEKMRPNRVSRFYAKARSILEFASGSPRECEVGDRLRLEEVP